MKTIYGVEIFKPDNAHDLLIEFSSDSPFMAISKGDILNTALWPKIGQRALRVVCVEHLIWESTGGPTRHRLSVYTTEVPNNPTSRLGDKGA